MASTKIRIDDQAQLGVPPNDGTFDDGLFKNADWPPTYSPTDAIDDINEVLGALAPPKAPALDDIDVTSNGVTADVSFGSSNGITGYSNVSGVGNLTSVDFAGTFTIGTTSGDERIGVIDDAVDLQIRFNADVSAEGNGAYPIYAFRPARTGTITVNLNGTNIFNAVSLNTGSAISQNYGTDTQLRLSAPLYIQTTGGDDFTLFEYRKGNYGGDTGIGLKVDAADMRNGWNYLIISTSEEGNTNYIDWVVDDATTATTYGSNSISNISMTGTKDLSGVTYHTGGSFKYQVTCSNPYLNTYFSTGNAVSFSRTQSGSSVLQSVSSINLTDPTTQETDDFIINDTGGDVASRTVNFQTSGIRCIAGSDSNRSENATVGIATLINRTVVSDGSAGGESTKTGFLLDNVSANSSDTNEYFNDENYRVPSNTDFTLTTKPTTSSWNESFSIADAGPSGYNDGMQVTNGLLVLPTLDYRNSGDGGAVMTEGPAGNPNYSTGVSGNRYYYRYFYDDDDHSNFRMVINGSFNPILETDSFSGTTDIKVSIRAPSQTVWMDAYRAYSSGDENAAQVDNPGAYASTYGGSRTSGGNWGLTIGGDTTGSSGNFVYIRISVPSNFTGYITSVAWTFSP